MWLSLLCFAACERRCCTRSMGGECYWFLDHDWIVRPWTCSAQDWDPNQRVLWLGWQINQGFLRRWLSPGLGTTVLKYDWPLVFNFLTTDLNLVLASNYAMKYHCQTSKLQSLELCPKPAGSLTFAYRSVLHKFTASQTVPPAQAFLELASTQTTANFSTEFHRQSIAYPEKLVSLN